MKDAFLFKAQENLAVAEWSYANGHFNACANRAYYAAFQATVAVLAHLGLIQARRIEHRAIQSLFNRELIHKRKIFPSHRKSYLSDLQDLRDNADDDWQLVSKNLAFKRLTMAKQFVEIIVQEINK